MPEAGIYLSDMLDELIFVQLAWPAVWISLSSCWRRPHRMAAEHFEQASEGSKLDHHLNKCSPANLSLISESCDFAFSKKPPIAILHSQSRVLPKLKLSELATILQQQQQSLLKYLISAHPIAQVHISKSSHLISINYRSLAGYFNTPCYLPT